MHTCFTISLTLVFPFQHAVALSAIIQPILESSLSTHLDRAFGRINDEYRGTLAVAVRGHITHRLYAFVKENLSVSLVGRVTQTLGNCYGRVSELTSCTILHRRESFSISPNVLFQIIMHLSETATQASSRLEAHIEQSITAEVSLSLHLVYIAYLEC